MSIDDGWDQVLATLQRQETHTMMADVPPTAGATAPPASELQRVNKALQARVAELEELLDALEAPGSSAMPKPASPVGQLSSAGSTSAGARPPADGGSASRPILNGNAAPTVRGRGEAHHPNGATKRRR